MGVCFLLHSFGRDEQWSASVRIIGLMIGFIYLVLLWFLFNIPDKLNLEEKTNILMLIQINSLRRIAAMI